jgi:hypothetical protein
MTHQIEIVATVIFSLAVLHTFSVKWFRHFAHKYKVGSIGYNLLHLLGEVEVVFGIWAGVLIIFLILFEGKDLAISHIESSDFTEPLFVFTIMAMASTRPVIDLTNKIISTVGYILPLKKNLSFYFVTLTVGPILGSFITEPAAMAVTALILKDRYFEENQSQNFKYATLAILLVNVSIGGVLTPYAAPPVLMVAKTWGWDLPFMLSHFGGRAFLAVLMNAGLSTIFFRKQILTIKDKILSNQSRSPFALQLLHVVFLIFVVVTAHHPTIFIGIFLFFLGMTAITEKHQDDVRLKESLLVGFFLAGLVVLGSFQRWWLEPLISSLGSTSMFLGTTALTSITDNAALTFLGAQIPNLHDALKYALVAGAVCGGGLTVIANAPNPAGFAILREKFGTDGISPGKLFLAALIPTLISMACFWFL